MVIIRKARAEEVPLLTKIVNDASRHWGYPEHWIKHSESDPALSSASLSNNDVYVAEDSGELQGFYLRSPEQTLEQLWVAPAHFGTGVGKELFLHAMERKRVAIGD
jgi:hypothetical protein